MKRNILKFLMMLSLCLSFLQPLFAEDTTPEPYHNEEFPETLQDLRRFEIITLGSMPFITLDVTLAYSGYNYVKSGFDEAYAPNIFAASSYTPEEQKKIILTSLGVSACVGLADYGVRLVKRLVNQHKIKNQEKSILVTPIEEDPDAVKLSNPYDDEPAVVEDEPAVVEDVQVSDDVIEVVE